MLDGVDENATAADFYDARRQKFEMSDHQNAVDIVLEPGLPPQTQCVVLEVAKTGSGADDFEDRLQKALEEREREGGMVRLSSGADDEVEQMRRELEAYRKKEREQATIAKAQEAAMEAMEAAMEAALAKAQEAMEKVERQRAAMEAALAKAQEAMEKVAEAKSDIQVVAVAVEESGAAEEIAALSAASSDSFANFMADLEQADRDVNQNIADADRVRRQYNYLKSFSPTFGYTINARGGGSWFRRLVGGASRGTSRGERRLVGGGVLVDVHTIRVLAICEG